MVRINSEQFQNFSFQPKFAIFEGKPKNDNWGEIVKIQEFTQMIIDVILPQK